MRMNLKIHFFAFLSAFRIFCQSSISRETRPFFNCLCKSLSELPRELCRARGLHLRLRPPRRSRVLRHQELVRPPPGRGLSTGDVRGVILGIGMRRGRMGLYKGHAGVPTGKEPNGTCITMYSYKALSLFLFLSHSLSFWCH